MMRTRRSFLAAGGGVLTVGVLAVLLTAVPLDGPARAQSLADAKRDGYVGERPDGYLGLVRSDAPTPVQALVTRINAERRKNYEAIALQTGTSTREVGILAGKKLIASSGPGAYIMNRQGRWVRP